MICFNHLRKQLDVFYTNLFVVIPADELKRFETRRSFIVLI